MLSLSTTPVILNYDRLVKPTDLVGTSEAAEILGCSKQQIASLRKNPNFPQPVHQVSATPLWVNSDVEYFKLTWVRRGKNRK